MNDYFYQAAFTNSVGLTNSNVATLTVNFAPTVTTNPIAQSATGGESVTFTAAASGNPTPAVQWEVSSDGGLTFSDIAGATSTSYSFTAAAVDNANQYEAVFTNSVGTATTTTATLHIVGSWSPPTNRCSVRATIPRPASRSTASRRATRTATVSQATAYRPRTR